MADTDFEGRIFEQPAGNVEKDRSRLIMIISGIAVFIVIGLILVQRVCNTGSVTSELARAGSPEFDSYKDSVIVSYVDRKTGERMTGSRFASIRCRIQNVGDKTIIAMELRMAAIDVDSNTRKEKLVTVIPSQLTGRKSLEPSDAMETDLNLEPIPDPGELMDIIVEVVGLKVK